MQKKKKKKERNPAKANKTELFIHYGGKSFFSSLPTVTELEPAGGKGSTDFGLHADCLHLIYL